MGKILCNKCKQSYADSDSKGITDWILNHKCKKKSKELKE